MYRIVSAPIELGPIYDVLQSPRAGAVLVFTGTVRDHNEGRSVDQLEYEAYAEMAEKLMAELGAEMTARWGLERVAMVHRVGPLAIGEVAVAVGVSAGHRQEAFEACRYGIDRLKAEVPIWKKEHFEAGAEWLENKEAWRS